MIRIRIGSQADYTQLREMYLEKIKKYVAFDEADLLDDSDIQEGKSENTAKELERDYTELYHYLYDSGKVDRKKLQSLLAGPETMPGSFKQNDGAEGTMREFFENIPLQPFASMRKNKNQEEDPSYKARECCEKIINYKKFIDGQEEAYALLRKLDVRVCPYCNRIYTVTLPSKEELADEENFRTTRATFDHFYPKTRYPYLALNLFNLVPSCGICNSNKSDFLQEIVYPYDESFEKNVVFRLVPNLSDKAENYIENALGFLHGEHDGFCIKFMGDNGISLIKDEKLEDRLTGIENEKYRSRIVNSIQQFKLEELYQEHKAEILDILKNRHYFNEQYVLYALCPLIQEKMKGAGSMSRDEIRDIAMDMLFFSRLKEQDWEKRPLAKLVSDLLD